MKRKGLGKRLLSIALSLSIVASVMPTNLAVFGDDQSLLDETAANANLILGTDGYVESLVENNSAVSFGDYKNSEKKLTWETETGKEDTWRYYNGVMLDAFAMVGGEDNYTFIKNFYDAILDSDGTPKVYHAGEVDSVPMGLALFDLLNSVNWDVGSVSSATTLDLTTVMVRGGNGIPPTVQDDKSIYINDINMTKGSSQYIIPLPSNLEVGDTINITIKGEWGATSASDNEGSTKPSTGLRLDLCYYDENTFKELGEAKLFVEGCTENTNFQGSGSLKVKSVEVEGDSENTYSANYVLVQNLSNQIIAEATITSITIDDGSSSTENPNLKYKNAIEYIYDELEKQKTYDAEGEYAGGNYLHKQDANGNPTSGWETWNIGLDSLYMTSGFLLEYANAVKAGLLETDLSQDDRTTLANRIYSEVATRLTWVADNMFDEETGLLNHGYSVTNKTTNGAYWGRGIGWYMVALVNAIDLMSDGGYDTSTLKEYLKTVLDGMLKWQDADTGLWTNVVNREELLSSTVSNKLETSGSAMMAYALMKAYNKGYVTDVEYGLAGLRAFNGIIDNKYSNGVISDTYQKSGVGTTDEYYCKEAYVQDEAKGTGALIMAATWANATATKLNSAGVNTDANYPAQVKDNATAISVAGSGATSITVTNETLNETVVSAVSGIFSDYKAYSISYAGDSGNTLVNTTNAGTITLPLPVGAEAEDVKVYKIDSSGKLTEIEGTIYRSNFVFRTLDTSATYVIGTTASDYDNMNWVNINKFALVNDMVPDREYFITTTDNTKQAIWAPNEDGSYTSVTTNENNFAVTSNNGLFDITNVSNKNTWYISKEGYIYSLNDNREKLYLGRSSGGQTVFGADTSYAMAWMFFVENGNTYIKMVNDTSIYFWIQSGGLYAHNASKAVKIYEKTQAALDGVLNYTVNASDGSVTESVIKENATVYWRSSGDIEPTIIPWDKVTYTWSDGNGGTEYKPDTAGTYTMSVEYGGVEIGTVTVTVKDTTWKDVGEVSDTYYLVDNMVPGQEYVFVAYENGNRSIYWTDSNNVPVLPESAKTLKVEEAAVDGTYKISPVAKDCTWYVDNAGRLYTIYNDGTAEVKYYLQYTESNFTLVTENNATTKWELDATTTDNVFHIKVVDVDTCIKLSSKGVSVGNSKNSQISFYVYGKNHVESVILDGKLEYNIKVGDSSVTEESIMTDALIYAQVSNSATTDVVDWEDRYVSYAWTTNNGEESLNTNKAGTYTLSVSYAGISVGSIVVKVTEPVWVDVTNYTYDRVQVMEEGKYYVIAESNDNSTIDANIGTSYFLDTLGIYATGNGYSTVKQTNIVANSDGTYTLTNVDSTNNWYYDENKFVYGTTVSLDNGVEGRYNLLNYNKDGKLRILSHKSYPNYIPWIVSSFEDGTVTLVNTVTSTTDDVTTTTENYLAYNNSYFYITTDSTDTNTKLTLYSLTEKPVQEATLDGKQYYSIVAGDKYVTETIVKKNVDILLKTTTDGTSTTSRINWTDEKVAYTWTRNGTSVTTLDSNVPGTYVMSVTYDGKSIGTVNVNVIERTMLSGVLSGNGEVDTYKGREPIFSDLQYLVTYSDGTKKNITVANGLTVSGYDLNTLGRQTAYVYYDGKVVGTVVVNVTEDVYAGLLDATNYPDYPNDGAVRIDKFADNSDFLFRNTGVTKVELDVAGITTSKALDVVLVVDVSNSMGWSQDWFEIYDPQTATEKDKTMTYQRDSDGKYVTDANGNRIIVQATEDKLDAAMEAATEFVNILLEDNVAEGSYGFEKNNTVSFVTFAGHDRDYYGSTNDNYSSSIDSVHTVFTSEQSIDAATTHLSATQFYEKNVTSSNGVEYKLQIGNTTDDKFKGVNRGNTNYDYAFYEAMDAIGQNTEYWENMIDTYDRLDETLLNERETVVIFMTDGAPSSYNDQRANGGASDYIAGTKLLYPSASAYKEDSDGKAQWTEYISNPNTYAQDMVALSDAFYVVGFDMTHGGFKNYAWEANELEPVLWNLAGKHSDGSSVVDGLEMPDNADELVQFYTDLANSLVQSGTEARVTDTIKSDFTLQMGTSFPYVNEANTSGGGEIDKSNTKVVDSTGKAVQPCIEVKTYDLWTKDEVENGTGLSDEEKATLDTLKKSKSNDDIIGTRQYEEGTLLEQVLFNDDGTAYSIVYTKDSSGNIKEERTDGILTTHTNLVTIEGEYFTYTNYKDEEKFVWKIGDINADEVALSYYVYLKNSRSLAKAPEDGIYDTNEEAILEYINVNNEYAKQVFPIPERSWGTAITSIEYYLVNENGQPVNWDDEVIPFADRIIVSDNNYSQKIRWGDTLVVNGSEHVPYSYKMYNSNAYYTVYVGENDGGSLVVTDEGKAATTTFRVDSNTNNYGATKVAFGVVFAGEGLNVTSPLNPDKVVIDYGKPIQIDVLANEVKINDMENAEYNAKVVGFVWYNPDSNYIDKTQSDQGALSLQMDYGTFTKVSDSTVQYTPNHIVSEVERVYVVVQVSHQTDKSKEYYVNQELDVIPATHVYYETDFASQEFTTQNGTTTNTDGSTSIVSWGTESTGQLVRTDTRTLPDSIQDYGDIGYKVNDTTYYTQTYGYDDSYTNDNKLSDGGSLFVEGQGVTTTTAEFSFKGTGFDIISVTGKTQGMIRVNVYDASTLELKKRMSVLNKHESVEHDFYQIPVISIEGLDYGNYKVVIEVFNSATYSGALAALSRDNDFYFDAVRIYDPLGLSGENGNLAGDTEGIGLQAYMDDGEAYPDKQEVRDILITAGNYDSTNDYNKGVLFIERSEGDDETSSTPTPTPTPTPTVEVTPSPTPTATATVTPTPSPAPTATESTAPSPSPTATETTSPSPSQTPSADGTRLSLTNAICAENISINNNSITFGANTINGTTIADGVTVANPFAGSDVSEFTVSFKYKAAQNVNAYDWNYTPLMVFLDSDKTAYYGIFLQGHSFYYGDWSDCGIFSSTNDLIKSTDEYIITCVVKSDSIEIYVDGVSVSSHMSQDVSGAATKTINLVKAEGTTLHIGGVGNTNIQSDYAYRIDRDLADGTVISNITTYNRALTPTEVSQLSTSVTSGVSEVSLYSTEDVSSSTENHNHEIAEYKAIGPNNETYLAEGQAIVFELTGIDTTNIASIDVGAKSIDGSQVNMKAVIANSSALESSGGTNYKVIPATLYSSTSQYIELYSGDESYSTIDGDGNTYIYIANTGVGEPDQDGTQLNTTNVLSITDIKVAYKAKPTIVTPTSTLSYVANDSLLSFADACYQLEPDYDIHQEAFTPSSVKIFGNADLSIETSEYVERLEITDRFGRAVDFTVSSVSTLSGTKKWNVVIMVDKIGDQVYKITGYGADGNAGETAKATVNVNKQEGGWQDAKSIYKTLFNCRILSIKRSGGSKLYGERK